MACVEPQMRIVFTNGARLPGLASDGRCELILGARSSMSDNS